MPACWQFPGCELPWHIRKVFTARMMRLKMVSFIATPLKLFAIEKQGLYILSLAGIDESTAGNYELSISIAGDVNADGLIDGLEAKPRGDRTEDRLGAAGGGRATTGLHRPQSTDASIFGR